MLILYAIQTVVLGVVIGYLVWALLEIQNRGRADVDRLEKRLIMSMKPTVLAVDSMDDEPPKAVYYVDDKRMSELGREAT